MTNGQLKTVLNDKFRCILLSRTYSQFTLFFTDFLVLKRDFSVTVQSSISLQVIYVKLAQFIISYFYT